MSEILDGDQWKHEKPAPTVVVNLRPRTRAEQQSWLDDQYGKGKITLKEWRFQFDLLSMEDADGSFPEIT